MPYLVSTPREILLNDNWIEISVYFSAAPMKQLYIRSMVHYRKYWLIVQLKKQQFQEINGPHSSPNTCNDMMGAATGTHVC